MAVGFPASAATSRIPAARASVTRAHEADRNRLSAGCAPRCSEDTARPDEPAVDQRRKESRARSSQPLGTVRIPPSAAGPGHWESQAGTRLDSVDPHNPAQPEEVTDEPACCRLRCRAGIRRRRGAHAESIFDTMSEGKFQRALQMATGFPNERYYLYGMRDHNAGRYDEAELSFKEAASFGDKHSRIG